MINEKNTSDNKRGIGARQNHDSERTRLCGPRRRQEEEDFKRLRIARLRSTDVSRRSRHEATQRYGENREGRGERRLRENVERKPKKRDFSSPSVPTLNKARRWITRDVSPSDGQDIYDTEVSSSMRRLFTTPDMTRDTDMYSTAPDFERFI